MALTPEELESRLKALETSQRQTPHHDDDDDSDTTDRGTLKARIAKVVAQRNAAEKERRDAVEVAAGFRAKVAESLAQVEAVKVQAGKDATATAATLRTQITQELGLRAAGFKDDIGIEVARKLLDKVPAEKHLETIEGWKKDLSKAPPAVRGYLEPAEESATETATVAETAAPGSPIVLGGAIPDTSRGVTVKAAGAGANPFAKVTDFAGLRDAISSLKP